MLPLLEQHLAMRQVPWRTPAATSASQSNDGWDSSRSPSSPDSRPGLHHVFTTVQGVVL